MYLKALKLRNFKSFAGTTEVTFHPGFTGVAGPNGMGKSNVADAILFCLGPRSSKVLRAERLPELFFNASFNFSAFAFRWCLARKKYLLELFHSKT